MGHQTDPVATRVFLEELYATADGGHLALFHLPSRLTTWVAVSDLATAAATIERLGQTGNVYIGIGVQPVPLGPEQRGTAATVSALPGLFMDIDLAGGQHSATALPATTRQVAELLRSTLPLSPSLVLFTGGGLHCYWLFHEVWYFDSDAERVAAARRNRLLQAKIISAAHDRGWHLESTADLARVLRPAGTVNRKVITEPAPVRIIHQSGARYGIEEVDPYLPAELEHAGNGPRARIVTTDGSQAPTALWDHVLGGCLYLRHCVDDAAQLDEPSWHAAMTVVARCRHGERLAHQISQRYPAYDEAETTKKFDHALKADAPLRCDTIRFQRGGESWCRHCPHWGTIASPIVLGYPRGYVPRRRERQEAASA